jgi:hypothetical protein
LEIVGAAVGLGVLGDVLLRATPWALNLSLWLLLATGTGLFLALRWRETASRAEGLVVAALFLLAPWALIRDASLLRLALIAATIGLSGLAVRHAQSRGLHAALRAGIGRLSLGRVYWEAWLKQVPDVLGADVRGLLPSRSSQVAAAAGRGLALAAAPLLVFGLLLTSADAVFAGVLADLITVDLDVALSHVALTLIFAFAAGGLLRGTVAPLDLPETIAQPDEDRTRFGAVETGVALGLVNLLFAAFVIVQLPYLFGGLETVLSTRGLTVAEYARDGFFELTTVAGLALVLLMVLYGRRGTTASARRAYQVGAGVQIALLGVMLASATQRMAHYVAEFGLTSMRLCVSAFLLWMAFGLAWFAWTVLRDRASRFTPGVAAAGFVMLVGLFAANPDAVVVHVNAERFDRTGQFDARYAASLSADAVPALLDTYPRLNADDQTVVARRLLARFGNTSTGDLRTWSWARHRARTAVDAHRAMLERDERG